MEMRPLTYETGSHHMSPAAYRWNMTLCASKYMPENHLQVVFAEVGSAPNVMVIVTSGTLAPLNGDKPSCGLGEG